MKEHEKRLVLFSEPLQSFFGFCAADFTANYNAKMAAAEAVVADAIRKATMTEEEWGVEMVKKTSMVVAPQGVVVTNELAFTKEQIVFIGSNQDLVKKCMPHKKDIHLVFVNLHMEKSLDDLIEMTGLLRDCAADNYTAIFLLPEGARDEEMMKKRVENAMKMFGKDKVTHYKNNTI